MECKHENTKRLYERGKSWTSTHLYKCQDCDETLQKGFEKINPKSLEKKQTLPEKTKDALRSD